MSIARAVRRRLRREKDPVASRLAEMVSQTENVARELFNMAALSGQPMPTRQHVEATAKRMVEEVLEPVVAAMLEKGQSPIEAEAYRSLLGCRIQLAFQERWAEMDGRHAKQAASEDPVIVN